MSFKYVKNKVADLKKTGVTGLVCAGASALTVVNNTRFTHALTISEAVQKFTEKFEELRGALMTFATAAAGVMGIIAFLFILFSKDDKKAGAAYDWLKRIALAYIGIMSIIGLISIADSFKISE